MRQNETVGTTMFIKIFELLPTKFLAYPDAAQLQLVSLIEV